MAAINRYSKTREGLVAAPLTVEDYTKSGMVEAQAQGNLQKYMSELDLTYDVVAKDAEYIAPKIQELEKSVDGITSDIMSGDITASSYDDAIAVKRSKNDYFGKHGIVTKAEENAMGIRVWEDQLNQMAVKQKWTAERLATVKQVGLEGFKNGTFNSNGTYNNFKPEYGPGYIDPVAYARETLGEVQNSMTEHERRLYDSGEFVIEKGEKHDAPGTLVLVNYKTGKVASNLSALNGRLNQLNTELNDTNSLLGENAEYFKWDKNKLKGEFENIKDSYVKSTVTPAQSTASLRDDPTYNVSGNSGLPEGVQNPILGESKTYSQLPVDSETLKNTFPTLGSFKKSPKAQGKFEALADFYKMSRYGKDLNTEAFQGNPILGYEEIEDPNTGMIIRQPVEQITKPEIAEKTLSELNDNPGMVSFANVNDLDISPDNFYEDLYKDQGKGVDPITGEASGNATENVLNQQKLYNFINNDLDEALTTSKTVRYEPKIILTDDKVFLGKKNKGATSNQSSNSNSEAENTADRLTWGGNNVKIWDYKTGELISDAENREAAITNITDSGKQSGRVLIDVNSGYGPNEKGAYEFDRDRLGALLIYDENGNQYLVERDEVDKKIHEQELDYEASLSIINQAVSTPMVLKNQNGTYGWYDVVKSTKNDGNVLTGFMYIDQEYDPSTNKMVYKRKQVSNDMLRDPRLMAHQVSDDEVIPRSNKQKRSIQ